MNNSQDNNLETNSVNAANGGVTNQPIEQPVADSGVVAAQQPIMTDSQPQVAQQPVFVDNQAQGVQQPVVQTNPAPEQLNVSANQPAADFVSQPVQPFMNNGVQQSVAPTVDNLSQPAFTGINPQVQPQPVNQNINNQNNKSGKSNIIFIVIVGVLVVGIATLSILYFTGKIGNKSSGDSSSSSSSSSNNNSNNNSNTSNSSSDDNNNSNNSNSSSNDTNKTFEINGVTMTLPDGYTYDSDNKGFAQIKGKYEYGFTSVAYELPTKKIEEIKTNALNSGSTVSYTGLKSIDGFNVYVLEFVYVDGTKGAYGIVPANNSSNLIVFYGFYDDNDLSAFYSDAVKVVKSATFGSTGGGSSNSGSSNSGSSSTSATTFEVDGVTMDIPTGYKYDGIDKRGLAVISNDYYEISLGITGKIDDYDAEVNKFKVSLESNGTPTSFTGVTSVGGKSVYVTYGIVPNSTLYLGGGVIPSNDPSLNCVFVIVAKKSISDGLSVIVNTLKTAKYTAVKAKSFDASIISDSIA